jgi:hypothetical protein
VAGPDCLCSELSGVLSFRDPAEALQAPADLISRARWPRGLTSRPSLGPVRRSRNLIPSPDQVWAWRLRPPPRIMPGNVRASPVLSAPPQQRVSRTGWRVLNLAPSSHHLGSGLKPVPPRRYKQGALLLVSNVGTIRSAGVRSQTGGLDQAQAAGHSYETWLRRAALWSGWPDLNRRPLRSELAAPLGVYPSSQLARCARGRARWRL